MLLDTHFHYDFLPPQERAPFVAELARRGACVVAQTLTPSAFVRLEAAESAHDAVPRLSVGYHPWHIGPDYAAQLRVFADALTRTRFVGEVGLDFAPRRLAEVPADLQTDVFRRLLDHIDAASLSDPHILSIHTSCRFTLFRVPAPSLTCSNHLAPAPLVAPIPASQLFFIVLVAPATNSPV
ncbi:TatD family hydrolase [Trueperella pyogenes]|uniref:TatD family hydrolase n=1 Tax=Trueperella pyogenes TaxID=1661 RepID=UPI00312B4D1C